MSDKKPSTSHSQDAREPSYTQVDPAVGRPTKRSDAPRPWTFSLCNCGQTGACCESYFCNPCQMSRQYNMLSHERPEIHWPVCAAVCLLDAITLAILGTVIQTKNRHRARERYNVEGGCNDCCASYCCRCCAVNQVLREMNRMGDCPGATCCVSMTSDFPTSTNMA